VFDSLHRLQRPEGLALIGVADTYNNAVKEILVTSLSAKVNTITNGLFLPASVAVDSMGNLFIADTFNSVVKESLAH
jgi:hypothetical protein